ncbi:hypothetical protein P1J78_21575 [Psychromarinibacter sp. C21-152]|uniref:DUF2946 family protein n=1 Tax=Psychromarinibacter sediminicola TaxID=3033385 RepID=A0AAE3NWB8_9RHOB|nr:hypothetical protein [Psychromarinibacter sediminicola]MDF0603327.1 hypothetical protein [Psychromarinibacter sediminicola]
MTRTRPFLATLLSLVLLATSGAMAVARGQAMAAGQIVLCTGTGPLAVAVDARGEPIGPLHVCPDCALTLLAAVDAPAPDVTFASRPVPVRFEQTAPRTGATPFLEVRARAPPLV